MSYKGKIPFQYDKNGKSWKEGAFKNWRGHSELARLQANNDRATLGDRPNRFHRFTESGGVGSRGN